MKVSPDGTKKRTRILLNRAATDGRTGYVTFPYDVFEQAILSQLAELDPHEILNGDHPPDETGVLAGQLAGVDSELEKLNASLEKNGYSETIDRMVRKKEVERKDLAGRLAEARHKAARQLPESWGDAKSLVKTLAEAPDPLDARVRLRSALRRIVDSICIRVVPRGKERLALVQVWFKGGENFRTYTIYYMPPVNNGKARKEGRWFCTSLGIDLRDFDFTEIDWQIAREADEVDLQGLENAVPDQPAPEIELLE
jgi:hypothetical protein